MFCALLQTVELKVFIGVCFESTSFPQKESILQAFFGEPKQTGGQTEVEREQMREKAGWWKEMRENG